MATLDGADGGASCARRRRERRSRAFWKHKLFAVRCAEATATHHNANKARRVDARSAPNNALWSRSSTLQCCRSLCRRSEIPSASWSRPSVIEYVAPAPRLPSPGDGARPRGLRPHLPQPMQRLIQRLNMWLHHVPLPVSVIEYVASSLVVACAASSPASEFVAPTPAASCAADLSRMNKEQPTVAAAAASAAMTAALAEAEATQRKMLEEPWPTSLPKPWRRSTETQQAAKKKAKNKHKKR